MSDTVIYADPVRPRQMAALAAHFPELTWWAGRDPRLTVAESARATIFVGWLQPPWIDRLRDVRWVQILSTGVPPEVETWCRERGVLLTRTDGVYAQSLAEHTLMLMLALARRLDASLRHQARREWAWPFLPPPQDLAGRTLGIVGTGAIGRALARLGRAVGLEVLGCRRRAERVPGFGAVYPVDRLAEMAALCDWLVIAVPATPATNGLVSRSVLEALPRGARVINIARGAVLDETTLVELLESRHLAGAALDVFQAEPLPQDSPLWTAPNLLITPHTGGAPMMASGGYLDYFVRNLRLYLAEEPMMGVVCEARR